MGIGKGKARQMRRSPIYCSFLRKIAGAIAAAPIAVAISIAGVGATLPNSALAQGDAKAGEKHISTCIGCHSIPGYKASFPSVYSVPLIAGQSEKYLVNALMAYRKGDRSHPTMQAIAGSLSDQDIADIAAYFADFK